MTLADAMIDPEGNEYDKDVLEMAKHLRPVLLEWTGLRYSHLGTEARESYTDGLSRELAYFMKGKGVVVTQGGAKPGPATRRKS